MNRRILFTFAVLLFFTVGAAAQDHINPEDRTVDMDSPTFVPMVHIGKAKVGTDSIQYVRTSNVYVFPRWSSRTNRRRWLITGLSTTSRKCCR